MLGLIGQSLAHVGGPSPIFLFIDKVARIPISNVLWFSVVLTVLRLAIYPYLKSTPEHLRTGLYPAAKFFNEVFDAIIYAGIVVFMIVRPFGIQTFFIPSPSMVDTMRTGDFILANKLVYRYSEPKFGDIIVFKPPKIALREGQEDSDFIKRCIGLPGDVIEMKHWVLYRNGKEVKEDYKIISDPAKGYELPADKSEWQPVIDAMVDFKVVEHDGQKIPLIYRRSSDGGVMVNGWGSKFEIPTSDWPMVADLPPTKVPEGMFLMIGDNRNGSNDGRFWGFIPRKAVIGRAEFVWAPLNRIKKLTNPHAK